jgi:DNA polymerase III subunit delta
MLTLLLGEEVFAKQAFLDAELAKTGAEAQKHQVSDELPRLTHLVGESLFGTSSAHVFVDCLKEYELPDLEQAANNSAAIYFWETSVDKRLTKTKQLFKIATVKEFPAPTREQAKAWTLAHAQQMEIAIQPSAAEILAQRMLGDTVQSLPVLAVHNELLKLSSYAGTDPISTAMVEELTPQDFSIDLFALLDAIGTKQKARAVALLQQYYDSSSEDDKQLTIRLVALLSDQLRSLLITKDLVSQGLSDQQILAATGWKSGRLFVMNKLGRNFSVEQLSAALTKLYNLDKELKTSTMPPRIIIDLIVAAI